MSFKVKIIIDGEESNVLKYSLGLSQGSDTTGRPSQKPVLHRLLLVLESNSKTDLMQWMISPNQTKQIELHIQKREGEKTRILYFSDAHLVGLDTTFSATGNTPMTDSLQITAAGLNTNDSTVEYSAYWRVTFEQNNVEATTIEESEPKLIEYHFENKKGETIEEKNIKANQQIELVITTENANGTTIKVNLNNSRLDFMHNGKIIENDILKGVKIDGEETRVPLTAIKQ